MDRGAAIFSATQRAWDLPSLPRNSFQGTDFAEPSSRRPRSREMRSRVLVVDDSEADVEMIRRCLADDAIEIRGVTDSAQAERVFTEFEPDCVLLDLHMPEPDVLEILRRIRDVR